MVSRKNLSQTELPQKLSAIPCKRFINSATPGLYFVKQMVEKEKVNYDQNIYIEYLH